MDTTSRSRKWDTPFGPTLFVITKRTSAHQCLLMAHYMNNEGPQAIDCHLVARIVYNAQTFFRIRGLQYAVALGGIGREKPQCAAHPRPESVELLVLGR